MSQIVVLTGMVPVSYTHLDVYKRQEEKAKILYDFLDQSKLFKGTVRKEDRSLMNVPFVTGDAEPVSYTHLDVYKRQMQRLTRALEMKIPLRGLC